MKKQLILLALTSHVSAYLIAAAPKAMPIAKFPAAKTQTSATTTTTKTPTTISIPLAYDVRIMNTSDTPATLTSITIAYGINDKTSSITKDMTASKVTIPANTPETLLSHQNMLSFGASITISSDQAGATATFQGITSIKVDGQILNLTTTISQEFASSIIYITNTAQPQQPPIWKLTTAPKVAPAKKETTITPVVATPKAHTVGTNAALHAAAAPLIRSTPQAPVATIPIAQPTSKANTSVTTALNSMPHPA